MARDRTVGNGAEFQLDRFEWAAPDRLEIAGSFVGIEAPGVAPTLVIGGAAGERRLTATARDSAVDEEQWTVAFLWQEPPLPVEAAELELGDGLSVDLPAPGSRDEALAIRSAARPAADTLRLEAALVAAQHEAREAVVAREQVLQELARAREDLATARSTHAADRERFKQELAQVRDTVEQALAGAQGELEQLRAENAEHRTARGHAEEEIRSTRDALEEARSQAAVADRLRERLDAVREALQDGP